MTGDGRDRDASTTGRPGTWVDELRERSPEASSPLREASRLSDLASRRPVDRGTRPAPDTTPTETTTADDSRSPLVRALCRAADFEDLELTGSPTDHRYGRVVAACATVDGRDYDLQLRLFRQPEDDDADFAASLADQLDRWRAVADLDGVVPVLDSGGDPRPWTCTAPVGATLADRTPASLPTRLRTARWLSATLAAVHDRGVCHTGLDPSHVVSVPGTDRPLLDSVGLLDVYRRYSDPASSLDPRYAPPEYFDDRYGIADRTTDVYGLGAVLYYLFTGEHPYDGSLVSVRESVLTDPFPTPSAVADVPEGVDDVVARATATDKFERYTAARGLHDDIQDLCLWLLDE
jgi:hypothetical protein